MPEHTTNPSDAQTEAAARLLFDVTSGINKYLEGIPRNVVLHALANLTATCLADFAPKDREFLIKMQSRVTRAHVKLIESHVTFSDPKAN